MNTCFLVKGRRQFEGLSILRWHGRLLPLYAGFEPCTPGGGCRVKRVSAFYSLGPPGIHLLICQPVSRILELYSVHKLNMTQGHDIHNMQYHSFGPGKGSQVAWCQAGVCSIPFCLTKLLLVVDAPLGTSHREQGIYFQLSSKLSSIKAKQKSG